MGVDPGTRRFDPLEHALIGHCEQVRRYVQVSGALAPELSAIHQAELRERGATPEQRQLTFEIAFGVLLTLLGVEVCWLASLLWG